MKRLWLISKYALTPETGNQEQRLYNIADLLKEKYEVTLITSNSNHLGRNLPRGFKIWTELKNNHYGFKIVYINAPRYRSSTSFTRIWSWIIFECNLFIFIVLFAKKKPDIALISSLSLLTVINGILLKIVYRTKFILDIRDIWPLTLIEIKGFKKYNPVILFLYLVERLGYNCANRITSTLEFFGDYNKTVKEKFYWLPQIYTPVPIVDPYFDFHKIRREFNIIVCYSGSIGFMNNIGILSDTAKKAVDNKIFFLVLGDGPLLEKMRSSHKDYSNVLFLGRVERRFLQSYLKQVDVLLHLVDDKPMKLYDRFGFSPQKYLDYYLSGKPIILTDTCAKIDGEQKKFIYQSGDNPEEIISMINKIVAVKHDPSIQLDYMNQHHIMNDLYKQRLYQILGDHSTN